MNFHPFLVHFPISLLILYSVLELLPFAKILPNFAWGNFKRFCLFLGTLATFPTILTGLLTAKRIGETPAIETHEHVALITSFTFSVISVIYLFQWYKKISNRRLMLLIKTLATVGLICILLTAILGGSLVFGSDIDIIHSLVAKLFRL